MCEEGQYCTFKGDTNHNVHQKKSQRKIKREYLSQNIILKLYNKFYLHAFQKRNSDS